MSNFENYTTAKCLSPGLYRIRLDRDWWIINGPNGGYLAGILLRTAIDAQGDQQRSPRSFTVHYMRPPTEGFADVRVTLERTGRTFSTQTIKLEQHGKLCVIGILASSNSRNAIEFSHKSPPQPPLPMETKRAIVSDQDPPLRKHFERRPFFGKEPWENGERALAGGWIRLSDSPDTIDAPLIATLSDCWPPAVFSWAKTRESIGDVPTIDLTIHFRRDPRKLKIDQNAFLLVRFETHTISEGYLVENGEIWTENGTLIAESRQLAVVG
ncbi:thioesterase family protein [Myxococcota bacterium]|nr:thioesterase family protein [Myxococcota bacterium]